MQKHELIAEVDTLLGGRAAEEVFIGEISIRLEMTLKELLILLNLWLLLWYDRCSWSYGS